MKIIQEREIKIPKTPNFIVSGGNTADEQDQRMIPIHELTDDQLEAIGAAWTRDLIKDAQRKRKAAATLIR